MPSKEVMKAMFDANRDGAGLMYVDRGMVNIIKGFMTFNDFYEYVEKLSKIHDLKEKALVMHFRISTQGNVDKGNCHPYPISSKEKDLRATTFRTKLGMAHNGIIDLTTAYGKGEKLNDTQLFIKDYVSVLYGLNKDFYKDKRALDMLDSLAGSKLCFMDTNEDLFLVGKFIEEDGIFYSNKNFEYHYYNTSKYSCSCYDDYYYDYNDYYYEDISSKKEPLTEQAPLSTDEFDYFMEFITPLEEGTIIRDCRGNRFLIDDDCYGLDPYFNVYWIDYENHDLVELYEDCTITYN